MSLYWNNEFWYFEKTPKKGGRDPNFVLVRKIFVSNIVEPFNHKDALVKHFKVFGEIDDIEIFDDYSRRNATNNEENACIYCAYVTFKESKSVYLALKDPLRKRKLSSIKIIPADTWRQPTTIDTRIPDIDSTSTPSPFMQMNNNCLLEIFSYLDLDELIQLSGTCLRVRQLIEQNIYPRYKSLVLNFIDSRKRLWLPYRKPKRDEINLKVSTLKDVHDKMTAVGRYVEQIKLCFDDSNSPTKNQLNRIMDIFTVHAGQNLKSLTILGIPSTERLEKQLQPILERLENLEWDILHYNCNFVNLCLNLRTLRLSRGMVFGDNVHHWPDLESVELRNVWTFQNGAYITLLKSKPNIKCIGIPSMSFLVDFSKVMSNISIYLKHLEKLVITDFFHELEPRKLLNATFMESLRTFKVLGISEEQPNNLLQFLIRVPRLSYIKLTVVTDKYKPPLKPPLINYKDLILLAKTNTNLKKLSLRKCKLRYRTISDFIRYAKVLEVFDLRACLIKIRKGLIEDIVEVQRKKIDKIGFLTLMIDQQVDVETKTLLRRNDIKEVLKVIIKSPTYFTI